MTTINEQGYLTRNRNRNRNVSEGKSPRDWWLVKTGGHSGYANLGRVTLPKKMVGKKVRFKVEVVEDGEG